MNWIKNHLLVSVLTLVLIGASIGFYLAQYSNSFKDFSFWKYISPNKYCENHTKTTLQKAYDACAEQERLANSKAKGNSRVSVHCDYVSAQSLIVNCLNELNSKKQNLDFLVEVIYYNSTFRILNL